MNKMALKYCFICLVLFGFVITANGGMYSWTDKNGVKHFSNSGVPPEYSQNATQSGEIKHSDDYYQKRKSEQGLKSQEINEERRQEKNEEMERKKREENKKASALEAKIRQKEAELNSMVRNLTPGNLDAYMKQATKIAAKKGEINRLNKQLMYEKYPKASRKNEDMDKINKRIGDLEFELEREKWSRKYDKILRID
jgi:hypothetical protein